MSVLCKTTPQRQTWAVSLCLSSAILMGIEALHPNSCQWMNLNEGQSFALSAAFATISTFLGTFILMQRLDKN